MRKYIDLILTETEILDEMPISNMSFHGDWTKNSGFNTQDRKLLNNPKAVSKIKAMWKYPEEVDYNLMMVNSAEAKKFQEVGDIGKIPEATTWLNQNMPKVAPELISNFNPEAVNIIFTNNTAAQRVPMTGWVAAHRFGHAIFRKPYGRESYYYQEAARTIHRYMSELAQQYGIELNGIGYGPRDQAALFSESLRRLMEAICTFRSARDGKLRNTFETIHELFAQYIVTGKLTFNEPPKQVKSGRSTRFYRGDQTDFEHDASAIQDDMAYELAQYMETACHYAVGHVFVM